MLDSLWTWPTAQKGASGDIYNALPVGIYKQDFENGLARFLQRHLGSLVEFELIA